MTKTKEFIYELKNPFNYAYKGDLQDASFITLKPPSYKQLEHFITMKQDFIKTINFSQESISAEELEKAKEKQDIDDSDFSVSGSDAIRMMYLSGVDVVKFMLRFQELCRSGAALIDGETVITKPLIEKIDLNDFELMAGEYIVNFIAPSLMTGD